MVYSHKMKTVYYVDPNVYTCGTISSKWSHSQVVGTQEPGNETRFELKKIKNEESKMDGLETMRLKT